MSSVAMRSMIATSSCGSPSAASAVFSDCKSLLAVALCATLDGGTVGATVTSEEGSAEVLITLALSVAALAETDGVAAAVAAEGFAAVARSEVFSELGVVVELVAAAAGLAVVFAGALAALPSRNFAAALKSEKVETLKSPAAWAVASAEGLCAEAVKSSVALAEAICADEDFAGVGACAAVVSAAPCSVCVLACD